MPTPGNPPGAKHPVPPVIEAGVQFMDGTHGARLRAQPQGRHRLHGALIASVPCWRHSPAGVARRRVPGYSTVTSALGDALRTSLTTEEFTNLLALLGGETAIVESVGLVPPLVKVEQPDYDEMAKIVGQVQMALVTGEPSGY